MSGRVERLEMSPRVLAAWGPVVLWGALIFVFSTSAFSAVNTARFIDPILAWLFPGISNPSIDLGHTLIRKLAHFTEYAILFWLLVRGPLAERPAAAMLICVSYALLDEFHQVFVMGRTASIYDVVLDSSGAMFSGFLRAALSEIV